MNFDFKDKVVLVTGGSGYVGGWAVVGLLQRGYRVRTTVRSLAREGAVRAAVASQVDPGDRLALVAADLLGDDGWDRAAAGCDFVLHVASPMGDGSDKGPDLLGPAREGTLRVLHAAERAGVERVVITSSVVASVPPRVGRGDEQSRTDENVWTDLTFKDVDSYTRAKTLAERAAWEFVGRSDGRMTLATILPGLILGPVIAPTVGGSLEVVSRMLTGRFPAIPRVGFSTVDVRDLVDLHIRAMVAPEAAGQRFIAAGDFLWMADIAQLLRDHLGPRAAKVPTRRLPDVVVRLLAPFQAEVRFLAPRLGLRREFDIAKAARLLDWHPRPAREAVLDCARSLLAGELIHTPAAALAELGTGSR